jgi:membrane protein
MSRVTVYWFVLTISPVLIMFSTYVDGRFQQLMAGIGARGWWSTTVGVLWSIAAIWFVMFTIYALFPNTKVHIRPAMAGALVAAVLLELGKRTMGIYLANALSISQLYGALGLIPLFMFWVYLMWLAVLFGLQVSSTLQHLRGRQLAELERQQSESVIVDPVVITAVMKRIAEGFAAGQATSTDQIVDAVHLPPPVVERILDRLVDAEFLHRLADWRAHVTLSRPPEAIPLSGLLDVAFAMVDRGRGGRAEPGLFSQLRAAQRQQLGNAHLGSLLDPS